MLDAAVPGVPTRRPTRRAVTTPVWLMRAMAGLVALAVLAGVLSLWAANSIDDAARTIGRDAEPSVALALGMAATLGDMDAAALGDALTDGGTATGTSRRFGDGMETLGSALVAAARNITYGEAEAGPLRDLQRGLLMYQRAVAEARGVGPGEPWLLSHRVQWASRVGRDFAVAPALALAAANASVLEQRYAGYRATSLLLEGAATGALLGLALAMVVVQVWLARRMRRIVNPLLAAATLVAAGAGLWFGVSVLTERADLRAAKADAYDSLNVLFQAKSVADGLRADMSLWLLDASTRRDSEARMAAAEHALIGADLVRPDQRQPLLATLARAMPLEKAGSAARALAETPHVGGLLGTELDNITFGMPERQAATDSVLRLVDAEGVMGAVQALELQGAHGDAVARWLTGGAAAFEALGAALDRTIAVNQGEFDRRVASALGTAGAMPVVACAALVLAVLLSVGGLWLRLREYR